MIDTLSRNGSSPSRGGILDFGIARSVRLSVPRRSCLGCLQLSHRRPPEMCGLRTRPRTDVDPPRFLDPWTDADGLIGGETICHRRTAISGGISSRRPRGDTLFCECCSRYIDFSLPRSPGAEPTSFSSAYGSMAALRHGAASLWPADTQILSRESRSN